MSSAFSKVVIDITTVISISIRPMTTNCQAGTSREVDSNEINQAGAGDVITSRSHDKIKTLYLHYQSVSGHQTWQDGCCQQSCMIL